jgi:2,3-bisphosphoglycerate-independent phosphoglycerate mutase
MTGRSMTKSAGSRTQGPISLISAFWERVHGVLRDMPVIETRETMGRQAINQLPVTRRGMYQTNPRKESNSK